MRKLPLTIVLSCLMTPSVVFGQSQTAAVEGIRGQEVLEDSAEAYSGYRKNWALLIGINYSGRQAEIRQNAANRRALPELKNAANDARDLADVLKDFYHYEQKGAVTLLTDDTNDETQLPTAERIRQSINDLCNPEQVHADDSVVIFFAGHGFKPQRGTASGGDTVSILPYDVNLSGGRPVGTNTFALPDELFELVEKIPAKNKLLILDCCYSGEIFNARGSHTFQSSFTAPNRGDRSLQRQPTFQAFASCRAFEVASDGTAVDGTAVNSKFTQSFLGALKRLPARSDGDRRVWANRILAYIRPEFDAAQRPDCRNLSQTHGEFCFYPREQERFSEAQLDLDETDKSHLKAMLVSRQGNWWFEEMPWFIPSIRSEIIRKHEETRPRVRSAKFSDLVRVEELKKTSEQLIQENINSTDTLRRLRFQHADSLIKAKDALQLEQALQDIERELMAHLSPAKPVEPTASPEQPSSEETEAETQQQVVELAAEDLHLLAVVQHALKNKERADQHYGIALNAYKAVQKDAADRLRPHILAALCQADRGTYQSSVLQEREQAAENFAVARESVVSMLTEQNRTTDSAAFFRISMLCEEADAWLGLNRWQRANDLFTTAMDIADALTPDHYLQAHVYRRRAWSKIIQWEVQEAKACFERSNQILAVHFRNPIPSTRRDRIETAVRENGAQTTYAAENSVDAGAGESDTNSGREAESRGYQIDTDALVKEPLASIFRQSTDHASKIAFLHNLHGVAMATRFQGDTSTAARDYRQLASEVEDALSRFRLSDTDTDLERQLITRVINTQERLGDCNLFGDPSLRDPAEAYDDYRRAMNRVHQLSGSGRDRTAAVLLYKQALALSLPSSVQNTDLALLMCRRADAIYEDQQAKALGLFQALGELTTKIVMHLHRSHTAPDADQNADGELREAITTYRDTIGTTRVPHRDQLELFLFAAKVLLEHPFSADSYQIMADSDLLLSFCRLALRPYQRDALQVSRDSLSSQSEAKAYLRPFYDTVIRAKLKQNRHVKDLLELHAEATTGERYLKPETIAPTLAIYALPAESWLLLDLPRGQDFCISLSEMYDNPTIRAASASDNLLPLPRSVQEALTEWRLQRDDTQKINVDLRWDDPIRGLYSVRRVGVSDREAGHSAAKLVTGQFPFALPEGFQNSAMVVD